MTLKDFKNKFEADLEEKWADGANKEYLNWDSFCFREWQECEDAEVEHEIMGWSDD